MEFTRVRNAAWADAGHTAVDCLVTFIGLGEVPFTASAGDTAAHSRAIFEQIEQGQHGVVAAYVAPVDPVPVPPSSVTLRQAKLALLGAGLLAGVDAAIDGMPTPQKEAARIEWEYAATVERQSPLVANLSAALSLDAAALDALFVAAAAL